MDFIRYPIFRQTHITGKFIEIDDKPLDRGVHYAQTNPTTLDSLAKMHNNLQILFILLQSGKLTWLRIMGNYSWLTQ